MIFLIIGNCNKKNEKLELVFEQKKHKYFRPFEILFTGEIKMHRKQKKYFISFKLIIYRPYFRKHNWSKHTNEGEMELVVANIKMKLRKDHNIVVKWIGSSVKIRLIMRSEWRPYKLLTNFQWRCSNLSYPISRFTPQKNVISHNRNPVKKNNYRILQIQK